MPIRNLLIWGAIALLLVVMFQMVSAPNPARDATERSYSQLINGGLASIKQNGQKKKIFALKSKRSAKESTVTDAKSAYS